MFLKQQKLLSELQSFHNSEKELWEESHRKGKLPKTYLAKESDYT